MNSNTFARLYSIFSTKRWHDKETHEIVFTNLCHLLGNLNDDQQNFLLDLIERYTWLSFSEYQSKLIQIFNNIPSGEIDTLKKIILFPIMNPNDEDKTKSGHGMLLLLRGLIGFLTKYSHLKFKEMEAFEDLEHPTFNLATNEQIYLLDDFLGSGDTIKSTIDKILTNPNITIDKIKVITIASHKQAINYMDGIGIQYYTDIITAKGITEYYTTPELEEKILLMNEIEKLLPTKKYNFGYGKSEGLITLYRTPNNTFPIFWHDYEKKQQKFKAPFPRY
ncbi:hypothetical protein B0A75_12910 [Flavobacterium oncorhynchi]|uniref:PRTase-CE domain-containing protein n=1 Tax=Flavobacterium oncorhynchi TaxID=728056 RepID=A0A226HZT5_9FLAO|nr:hypothetical protein [Flavobacterium oncorhynchi]OXA98961.1 hypothetical protein B0A75_12910 [Flavobacterium oncorhynchi]